jgi:hypothetical protein
VSDLDTKSSSLISSTDGARDTIESIDEDLLRHFEGKFLIEPALIRTLRSFQANTTSPNYPRLLRARCQRER